MLTVLPLDVAAGSRMRGRFHGDPADRLIVATARSRRIALATHDAAIRRSRAAMLWKP
jgi:PIN domain nuclease of toxin-antitoxin system